MQEIEAELVLIDYLYQHGFPTAPILVRADGHLLPDFILLSYLADAAEYVWRALNKSTEDKPIERCRSYKKFCNYSSPPAERVWTKLID